MFFTVLIVFIDALVYFLRANVLYDHVLVCIFVTFTQLQEVYRYSFALPFGVCLLVYSPRRAFLCPPRTALFFVSRSWVLHAAGREKRPRKKTYIEQQFRDTLRATRIIKR